MNHPVCEMYRKVAALRRIHERDKSLFCLVEVLDGQEDTVAMREERIVRHD